MPEKVCSIAFREGTGLLIAFESGLSFYDLHALSERRIVDVEPDIPVTRLNDGRCDRQGRFVVGGYDPSEKGLSGAYRLDTDLSLHRLFGGPEQREQHLLQPGREDHVLRRFAPGGHLGLRL